MKDLPDAYFTFSRKENNKLRFFLAIVDPYPNELAIKSKIGQYFTFSRNKMWSREKQFPEIIFIIPDKSLIDLIKNNVKYKKRKGNSLSLISIQVSKYKANTKTTKS